MKVFAAVIFALSVWCVQATAGPCPFGRLAVEYLEAQARTSTPLVYAECRQPWGKSVLIFPVSPLENHQRRLRAWGNHYRSLADTGLLIQLNGSCAENTATLKVRGDRFVAHPASGLLGVEEDDERVVTQLTRQPFKLLMPSEVSKILKSTPAINCENP